MGKSLEKIQSSIRSTLSENQFLSLATHGVRLGNQSLPYWEEDFDIYCLVPESQTLENIKVNPRVSFSVGNLESGKVLHGNGIAHIEEDATSPHINYWENHPGIPSLVRKGKIVKITPYRLEITDPKVGIHSRAMLEKGKSEWRVVESDPVSSQLSSGIVNRIRFWLAAARWVTFPLSGFSVAIGTALAFIHGFFRPGIFLLALVGGMRMLAHAGINLISDYYDFKKGVDTTEALSSHPGALVKELIEPERLLLAAFLAFLITMVIGTLLFVQVGWPVLLFGGVGLMGGYFYTGCPLSYKYRGLGELFISLLM